MSERGGSQQDRGLGPATADRPEGRGPGNSEERG